MTGILIQSDAFIWALFAYMGWVENSTSCSVRAVSAAGTNRSREPEVLFDLRDQRLIFTLSDLLLVAYTSFVFAAAHSFLAGGCANDSHGASGATSY